MALDPNDLNLNGKELPLGFVERLADRLGAHAHAQSAFGEPVHQGDVVVIPVAKVRWGLGGGGPSAQSPGAGGGGGGGVQVTPLGYIEVRGSGAQYRPIRDPASIMPLLVILGLFAFLIARTMRPRERSAPRLLRKLGLA